eukprot:64339-Prorocentrum_minimum.AAC.1
MDHRVGLELNNRIRAANDELFEPPLEGGGEHKVRQANSHSGAPHSEAEGGKDNHRTIRGDLRGGARGGRG